jgi:hypothetical protein
MTQGSNCLFREEFAATDELFVAKRLSARVTQPSGRPINGRRGLDAQLSR